jgi:benzylsuccinate CoA-transferase BbsF subunit
MQETGVSAIGPAILEAQRGIQRPRLGCGHWWKSPHNVYPCRGDDRWIAIVVSTDEEWQRLKEAMGHPAWAEDCRFDSALGRWQHREEMDQQLSQWTAQQDDREMMDQLQARSVCAGAVLTAQDLTQDSHLAQRKYFQKYNNPHCPNVGPRVFAGRPFRWPGVTLSIDSAAALGQHNVEVLHEVAGLSGEEIQELAQADVISTRPRPEEAAP